MVVGLALVLVYNGRDGWFGPALENAGFQVIFASPGMIMATVFVALPLVIREVVPVLEEIGDDQEQAAQQPRRQLGARPSAGSRCRRIKWAVVYGVVLSLARSIGEFGAVKIVSGNIAGQTMTAIAAGRGRLPELRAGHGVRRSPPCSPSSRWPASWSSRILRPKDDRHEHQRQRRHQEVR